MNKLWEFLLISVACLWFLFAIWDIWIRCSTRTNRETKLYIVSLLQENNPELEGEQLQAKVNEIYNIVSGN